MRSYPFQSRTGSTGHLACFTNPSNKVERYSVSIPNGLPRPFSPRCFSGTIPALALFQSRTGSTGHLANTKGPFLYFGAIAVSIPNGLPRPFSPTMPDKYDADYECFNPERAPQAI